MAHDHGEKIHYCKPCGYWHVADGRFQVWVCPSCKKQLAHYSSRHYLINSIDKRYEGIPANKVRQCGAEGYVK